MKSTVVLLLHFLLMPHIINCWNDGTDAVLLRDVQVLTLYRGRYTTARRSSPVLQLQCIGGSAGCGSFVMDVVQCYNKGWDGIDVQWECKSDMDNWYRFGRVEVSCEGYTSPNDPYVLKGSCGLEYTLELTAEGKQQQGRDSQGSSGFSGFFQGFSDHKPHQSGGQYKQSDGDGVSGIIVLGFFLLLAYGVYKMFLCSPTQGHQGFPRDDSQGFGGAWDNSHGAGPPPPGFKPDFYTDQTSSGPVPGPGPAPGPGYGFSDEYTRPQTDSWTGFNGGRRTGGGGGGGGGFWPGMGAGSILGYLFGNQRRQPHMGPSYTTGPSYTSRPSPKPKTSSGTRTASGFGGTKKR
ncbi:store-operated calcium entry-associated regulatory factor [Misgurnus anguillicaudatus]|uniref:store-operated calcium entry-associated regulatory factor n=1 Tax=Misgurnus anguillicaudatus TaxID=75329 RepID=UPI002435F554|nr:store-operated calcium entry-associated regulatory factor [Misgurnus anguillicaudatus]